MSSTLVKICKSFEDLSSLELYEILKLRQQVFMLEQKCLYLDLDGYDQEAKHLLLYDQQKALVAYARLFNTGMPYPGFLSIGRVVTHPQKRKQAYGKYLMQQAIQEARDLFGPYPIKIGAQAYLTGFYSSFGFKDIKEYYLEDGIPHLKMILN